MKRLSILVICIAILTGACRSAKTDTNARLYRQAIKESMYPETDKVDTTLIPLTPDNPGLIKKTINGEEHILMVTWKAVNYYPDSGSYNTGYYQIWVTAAPQLLNRFKKESPSDTAMRLKQLLGLPPNGEYKIFVEFWVKPSDMFRPCPDKEVTDSRCNT
ncbi:MAG TPA: hypothetical protein VEC12_01155, partial [Bacteroidia bacterium]|nr:hypothetical protein [Bacteroidia bacterium]